ncbi:unnamed protein product [Clonostachys solani]|uniref:Uncharacterized protein n=1 Tax=Clonostachys solani TaxID=160281 RepID=A0A9N9ZDS9_9HYPO|nr:unnamed protein product [Clonostachys solani]
MHFLKLILSISVSVASAQFVNMGGDINARDFDELDSLSRRDIALSAHEEYLEARDEYIEKRELFRRLGGNGKCYKDRKSMSCKRLIGHGKGTTYCGKCRPTASTGEYCLCNA